MHAQFARRPLAGQVTESLEQHHSCSRRYRRLLQPELAVTPAPSAGHLQPAVELLNGRRRQTLPREPAFRQRTLAIQLCAVAVAEYLERPIHRAADGQRAGPVVGAAARQAGAVEDRGRAVQRPGVAREIGGWIGLKHRKICLERALRQPAPLQVDATLLGPPTEQAVQISPAPVHPRFAHPHMAATLCHQLQVACGHGAVGPLAGGRHRGDRRPGLGLFLGRLHQPTHPIERHAAVGPLKPGRQLHQRSILPRRKEGANKPRCCSIALCEVAVGRPSITVFDANTTLPTGLRRACRGPRELGEGYLPRPCRLLVCRRQKPIEAPGRIVEPNGQALEPQRRRCSAPRLRFCRLRCHGAPWPLWSRCGCLRDAHLDARQHHLAQVHQTADQPGRLQPNMGPLHLRRHLIGCARQPHRAQHQPRQVALAEQQRGVDPVERQR